ncbi:Ti-type conjugative transfer relaxase TraA [Brevundimonas mediterranea]|jgi:Ti-type conjugative transfer relaxase TraA|uniref:Ti-type conjugative transfer relaxase TraA n=1 Tax=Brevundimonas mediterranea TaxID=74329 RepID=A0AB37E4C7_9CAUL|nr:Ti-type conjugative transfer relaxase TraA [Brevundimonas mediterranea]QIH72039.1 Ti-type conjugative transfer relaxase TraA [Brevundimonas mediterranea]
MAIYHLAMKPISRSSGRSAVAAAAYRASQKLTNERDGQTHDFTARRGVEHTEIVLPEGADAEWAQDRSALWNAAEFAEARKDARVAREVEVALPHELTPEQRLALTREFAHGLADRYGVAVDFAIHSPHGDTDVRNHHAHILLTTRKVEREGLGEKSEIELENKRLIALGLPTSHDQLRDLRLDWEDRANRHLALAGHDLRIDHRSHQACGLEIEPTQHMGVHATQMDRRGKPVVRARQDAEQAQRNATLIREKPEQALTLVTNEKSVFDRTDVAKVIHRYVDDPDAFQRAFARAMASPALVELRPEQRDEFGRTLEPARYSTQEMIAVEKAMADSADRMAESRTFGVDRQHTERALTERPFLAGEQSQAVRHIIGPERIGAVVGMAGAGKSTMLGAARQAWEAEGYRVMGAALAGKAAEGLEESSGIASRTLASWERSWERGRHLLDPRSVLVIDEAGMVGSRQLSRVLAQANRSGAKVVLVGDPEQLQPIGPGAAFRAVAERVGFVELGEIRRQREGWQREASVDFARHRTAEGLTAYAEHGAVRLGADTDAARNAIVRNVIADMDARPDGSRLVLAHRRVDVAKLNDAIRAARQDRGELRGEQVYRTTEGHRAFAAGDRLLFRENDRDLGLKNGMLGTVERAEAGRLEVRLDTAKGPGHGRAVSVSMADYAAVDHGYATTIHKAQGATVDRTHVLASATMDRHLTYVAMTRHRETVTLYAGRETFRDVEALSARLSRAGLKETTLDYAARRGLDARPPATGHDAEPRKRGMFDGLTLNKRATAPSLDRVEGLSSSGPGRTAPVLGQTLELSVERYARAMDDAERMRSQKLPVLAHQTRELRDAGAALDRMRPGATRDLHEALRHEPATWRAMRDLRGKERGVELAGAIRHEDRVRADPTLKADRLVKDWKRLEAQHDRLDGWRHRPARQRLEGRMTAMAGTLKRDPELESLVRSRARELGVGHGSTLGRVMSAPSVRQAALEIGRDRDRGPAL